MIQGESTLFTFIHMKSTLCLTLCNADSQIVLHLLQSELCVREGLSVRPTVSFLQTAQ